MSNVDALDEQTLVRAVHQMVRSKNFIKRNPELTEDDISHLLSADIQWPDKPVFSPYTQTHDGYSQIRIEGAKHLIHRVTYKQHFNTQINGSDVSHCLYLGNQTTLNVNPLHLTLENNFSNQTRKFCFHYLDTTVRATGRIPSEGELTMCRTVHSEYPCMVDIKYIINKV
ncbi:hypothetical protein TRICI_001795 [Trichomonascus ciferrii]|uniref:Uncharacterized protein n=1 Tax=Trichomonascus ciferrii TaxID=44093 RepID=A0A642V8E4_9ASCO|nr:hypothetical protein TRICI_001795 [Trichomonascus ciferrii]